MILRPPRSTRTDTLCPYTTLFRSLLVSGALLGRHRLRAAADEILIDVVRLAPQAADDVQIAIGVAVERAGRHVAGAQHIALELLGDVADVRHLVEVLVELLRLTDLIGTLLDHLNALPHLLDLLEDRADVVDRDAL